MAQQTAVDWLLTQIENKNGKEFSSYYTEFIEQAKAMEKENIEEAYNMGTWNKVEKYKNGEQYYNETYNK